MGLTPYQKIMRAAERGAGCRLTPEDVLRLSMDDAISRRAELDSDPEEAREDIAAAAKMRRFNPC